MYFPCIGIQTLQRCILHGIFTTWPRSYQKWRFVCKLKLENKKKKSSNYLLCSELTIKPFKNLDKSSAGMADKCNESNHKPQAPKKPRRGWAQSQDKWVITPYVVKIQKRDLGMMKALLMIYQQPGDCKKISLSIFWIFCLPQTLHLLRNQCLCRIILHLKPVIWHSSAT